MCSTLSTTASLKTTSSRFCRQAISPSSTSGCGPTSPPSRPTLRGLGQRHPRRAQGTAACHAAPGHRPASADDPGSELIPSGACRGHAPAGRDGATAARVSAGTTQPCAHCAAGGTGGTHFSHRGGPIRCYHAGCRFTGTRDTGSTGTCFFRA